MPLYMSPVQTLLIFVKGSAPGNWIAEQKKRKEKTTMDKKVMTTEELKNEIRILNRKSESLNEMNEIINSIQIDGQHFSAVLNFNSATRL
jgi:hypothetical protein